MVIMFISACIIMILIPYILHLLNYPRNLYVNFLDAVNEEYHQEEIIFDIDDKQKIVVHNDGIDFHYKNEYVTTARIYPIVNEKTGEILIDIRRFKKPFRENIEMWMKQYLLEKEAERNMIENANKEKMKKLKEEYMNEQMNK